MEARRLPCGQPVEQKLRWDLVRVKNTMLAIDVSLNLLVVPILLDGTLYK
jgi:hypothetical protein